MARARSRQHKRRNRTRPPARGSADLHRPPPRPGLARQHSERAETELRELARRLQADHAAAAASLREGLEETLTVTRLGLSPSLLRTRSGRAFEPGRGRS